MGHLVGQVSSSARLLPEGDDGPLYFARSKGPWMWAEDGRRYVDTAMSYGATMLGHAPDPVVEAVGRALTTNPCPAYAHRGEEAAAAALARITGPLSKVVFNNSGSEAVQLALRTAQAATGRRTIAKLAAGFDGWLGDMLFGNVNHAEAQFHDQERPRRGDVTLLRFNDPADTERLFEQNDDIAAIIYEPMLANAGCMVPADGYLEHLQETARRHGALLIADEVLMGLRVHAGLTSHWLGLDPDLATIGKAAGSGITMGAVIGRPRIMALIENGTVQRFGTYSGNPLVAAAVEATIPELEKADYGALLANGNAVRAGAEKAFADAGEDVVTTGYGSVFTLWFSPQPPRDYEEARAMIQPDAMLRLHLAMRRGGALVMPAAFGRTYITFAHDEEARSALQEAYAMAATSF